MSIREGLQTILDRYLQTRTQTPFRGDSPVAEVFRDLSEAFRALPSVSELRSLRVAYGFGKGNWAKVPWLAFLGNGETIQDGVYCVYLFRQDMTGIYLTFNQGVAKPKQRHGRTEARRILQDRARRLSQFCDDLVGQNGFATDGKIDLRDPRGIGADFELSTIAYKFYPGDNLPAEETLLTDLEAVLQVYDRYLESPDRALRKADDDDMPAAVIEEIPTLIDGFNIGDAIWRVIRYIRGRGFVFEPWQIAEYVTALRTKPFVILAGITGTGKSKLPALVAEATGSNVRLVAVRPDWTDSSDVLGYVDLQGRFRAGAVLEIVRTAMEEDDRYWVCIVDEMNLARVEQYFAEILSRMEDRRHVSGGGFKSTPLVDQALNEDDADWGGVYLPPNLALVGTVNMDETTHAFSRKVLDRAFTIELSDISLEQWERTPGTAAKDDKKAMTWPLSAWQPRAIMLSDVGEVDDEEREQIDRVIRALLEVNDILKQAQLQVAYRTRDEIALFALHAHEVRSAFVTRDGEEVDPLDLALQMKILPRIVGGSGAVRRVVLQLLTCADGGKPLDSDDETQGVYERWLGAGRPSALKDAKYPCTAARLCLMWERFESEGFTSYWL